MGVFIHVESAVCTSSSSPFPTSTSFTLFWRSWMNERCPEANELFRLSVYLCFSSSLVVPIGLPFARSSFRPLHLHTWSMLRNSWGWGGVGKWQFSVGKCQNSSLFTLYSYIPICSHPHMFNTTYTHMWNHILICQYTDTIMDRYVFFQCLQYSYVFLSLSIYIQIFLDYANLCTCILMYYSLKIRMSIQPIMICNMHIVSCPRTPLSLNTSV